MQNQQRQLAAILFTDIVGYTALMQVNEEKAVALIKHYSAALNRIISLYNGNILNYYGDGSLCTFPNVMDAMNAAMALQKELQSAPAVPLRIGLHLGEVFFEEEKALGDSINIASRIQSLGQANTILFSKDIFDKIRNQPSFKSVSLGTFEFKNVGEPMEIFALANEGLVVPKREDMSGKLKEVQQKSSSKKGLFTAAMVVLLVAAGFLYKNFSGAKDAIKREKTIAVLPFKNISINKEENEPFCVGVALELQKNLEWVGGLTPIAPQSVEKYRETNMSITDIASELGGISYIVQGSVQRDKNKIKVFASLIDAETGKQLWNNDYPGVVDDIFSLQENIAQQIAAAMQVKISPEEANRIARVPTKNTNAWDVFNEAQLRFVKYAFTIYPDEKDYIKIQSLCDKALALDSNLAEAYVLKARSYWIANERKQFFSENFMDTVKLLCSKALAIDNNSVDALVQLSDYYHHTGKKELALEQVQKAITLNPNSFAANVALGNGNPELYYDPVKSVKYLYKALKLDPLSVWTPDVYNDLAYQYLNICNFDKSQLYSNKVLELEHNTKAASRAYWCLVVTNNRLGNADKAIELAEKWNKIDSSDALYHMAEAYCYLKNDYSKGVQIYERYFKKSPLNFNTHRWAIALSKTGKKVAAFKLMNESVEQYKKLSSLGRFDSTQYDIAGVYAFMGDKTRAYNILNLWGQKYHWPWGSPYLIKFDPLFENLWGDKEFKDIVQAAMDEKVKLREIIKKLEESGKL